MSAGCSATARISPGLRTSDRCTHVCGQVECRLYAIYAGRTGKRVRVLGCACGRAGVCARMRQNRIYVSVLRNRICTCIHLSVYLSVTCLTCLRLKELEP